MTTPIFALNVIELANLAGCYTVPNVDSDGAEFLIAVMDAVEDAIDNGDELDERLISELAYDAPSGVIATRWQQFVDLKGWQFDSTDVIGDRISASRLSEHIRDVLALIAENLIRALVAEYGGKNTDGE